MQGQWEQAGPGHLSGKPSTCSRAYSAGARGGGVYQRRDNASRILSFFTPWWVKNGSEHRVIHEVCEDLRHAS